MTVEGFGIRRGCERMAGFQVWRAFLSWLPLILAALLFVLPPITGGSLCPEKQFLHSRLQRCLNCSECRGGMVALRPCELHRDTHCGPIGELIRTLQASQPQQHHKHRHSGHREETVRNDRDGNILWRYGDDIPPTSNSEGPPTPPDGNDPSPQAPPIAMEVSSSETPFSGAETLVWDWQAVALTTAVFACVLFFLAVTLYSLHQARQWRRLKENFEHDVEELSARLSLMAATTACTSEFKGDKCELLIADKEAFEESDYFARCRYLQKLLTERQDEDKMNKISGTTPRKGNVYIEETNSKT